MYPAPFYINYKHFYICHRGLRVMLAHFLTNPANQLSLLRQRLAPFRPDEKFKLELK